MNTRRLPHNEMHQARERIKGDLTTKHQLSLQYHPPGIMRLVGDMQKMGVNEKVREKMTPYSNHDQKGIANEVYQLVQGDARFRAVREALQDKDKGMQVHLFLTMRAQRVYDMLLAHPSCAPGSKELVVTPFIVGNAQSACLLIKFALLSLLKLKNKCAPTELSVKTSNTGIISGLKSDLGLTHAAGQGLTYSYADSANLNSLVNRILCRGASGSHNKPEANAFNANAPIDKQNGLQQRNEALPASGVAARNNRAHRRSTRRRRRSRGAAVR